jgi:type I restriction enzyme S subunit
VTEEHSLPPGWAKAVVEDLADEINPGFPYGRYNTEGKGFPQLRPMNIDGHGMLCLDEVKYVDLADPPLLQRGDILFNNTNSPIWVGKTTTITRNNEFTYSNHMTRIRLSQHAGIPSFFAWQLHYLQQSGYFFVRCTHHVNQASISSSYLAKNVELYIAPFAEQQRIVEAIEERFSHIDAGVALLKAARRKLRLYRASVLKAAVEGKLTEQWRGLHPDIEPAPQLLRRILSERRARWEEEQRAKGRDPHKLRYVEPAAPDASRLPPLPDGWCWATVEQLAALEPRSIQSGPFGSALLHSEFQESGILAIGIDNVLEGAFSMGRQHRISYQKYKELEKFTARPLDVLITVMATVGRCCVLPADLETAIITKHVYRISANQTLIIPHFLMLCFLGGREVRRQLFGQVQGQTRPGINGEILKRIAIPIPPLAEQEQIVALVEEQLSIMGNVEATIEHGLRRAERQRQSVLRQAFTGQLVPQDERDEPASVLLERIRGAMNREATHGERRERGQRGESQARGQKKPGQPPRPTPARPPASIAPPGVDASNTVQPELWEGIEAG